MDLELFRGLGVAAVALLLFLAGVIRSSPSRTVVLARALVVLGLFHAAWTLVFLPGEFLSTRAHLQYRQAFYESVAFMPLLAVIALVALIVLSQVAPVRGADSSLRAWCISRGQLLIAAFVIVGQLWLVNRAVCPDCVPFPAGWALAFVVGLPVVGLMHRFWRARYDETHG